MDRRDFVRAGVTSAAALVAVAGERVAKAAASERLRVGLVGCGGRALSLLSSFSANEHVDVVRITDVDPRKFPRALEEAKKRQGFAPETSTAYRDVVEDPKLDAIVVGTPDHWHAIPTIEACVAGKDVYVEKPDGHNIVEGRTMVAAARKHGRIVQMGSQHRSTQRLISALEYVGTGALGKVLVARAWETTKQGNIGRPADGTPPAEVDYDVWLGPAPKRPFNRNRFHSQWRWFFDYGTGDLGNDGVHRLDMSIAVLDAASRAQGDGPLPPLSAVNSSGGKWYFDDDQEFADTLQVNYEFGETGSAKAPPKLLTYEMRIWSPYTLHSESEGSAIYGDKGYLIVGNSRWRAYGPNNTLVKEVVGDSHEAPHVANFVDCIKTRAKPACDLETIGHPASVLCHAGNVSTRVGRKLVLDPATEEFTGDLEANALRGRPEWRKPYVLPEV